MTLLMCTTSDVSARTDYKAKYIGYVEQICEEYGCCPELIEALITTESNWDANATGSCGDAGLMQVIPKYHKDRIKKLGVTNIYDPYSNILVGVDFVMELADEYKDLPVVLTAYNTGRYSKATKRAIESGEGNKYAKKIMELAEEMERANGK